jgi:hypothetical protein
MITQYARPSLILLYYVYDFCLSKAISFMSLTEFSLLHLHIVICGQYNWGVRENSLNGRSVYREGNLLGMCSHGKCRLALRLEVMRIYPKMRLCPS